MVSPDGYAHAAAFAEVVETVVYGLRALDVAATYAVNRLVAPGPPAVVLGANLLTSEEAPLLPPGTVVYNLEQIGQSSSWCSPLYLELLQRHEVWDYSARNIASLSALSICPAAKHVPIGYVPELTRIKPAATQDIDVLFYGSMNERRAFVIEALRQVGLQVHTAFGVYGALRDALISRAKVVLNLHYYDTSIFEVVRVSYLLANRKAVVAECHPGTEIDADMCDAVRLAPYGELVDACMDLVRDQAAREAQAEQGFARMTARDEAAYLRAALGGARTTKGW